MNRLSGAYFIFITLFFSSFTNAQWVPFNLIRSVPNTTITYITRSTSATDASSYTFSSVALGAPAPNRYILVGVASRSASTFAISTVTVDGVSATILYQSITSGSIAGFALALLPSNSTGDIVVTFAGTMVTAGIAVWVIGGLQSTTPYATSFRTTVSGTINVPAGGVAVGMCYNSINAQTWSTGLSSNFAYTQTDSIARNYAGGSYSTSTAVTPLSNSLTGTASTQACAVISLK